jgi:hypothetical protein
VRALPMSSHSKARHIKVLRSKWNKELYDELNVAGPNDKLYDHDDQWDAASSAFNWLMGNRREYAYQAARKDGAPCSKARSICRETKLDDIVRRKSALRSYHEHQRRKLQA